MSTYLVADETINRVLGWLYLEVGRDPDLKEQFEDTLRIDTTSDQWHVKLGQAMFQLNVAGVNARYGEGEAKHFRELHYRYTPERGAEIQVLKSLQCWLYQCMEGDVVKQPLYRFFHDVVEPHLMRKIIGELPEYAAAAWE